MVNVPKLKLAMAFLGDYMVASEVASKIVSIEWTNFAFDIIQIRPEMAEIWPK